MSNGESTFQVSPAEAGERLDRVVAPRVGELSRGQVQKLIAAGEVRVNGEEAKPSLRVKAGDSISICPFPKLATSLWAGGPIPNTSPCGDSPGNTAICASPGRRAGTLTAC